MKGPGLDKMGLILGGTGGLEDEISILEGEFRWAMASV